MPSSTAPPALSNSLTPLASFKLFAADVASGAREIRVATSIFILLGAATEGFGLMLLLPLVNVVGKAGLGGGLLDRGAARVLALLPSSSAVGQIAGLLGAFAALMAVRAWALVNRDVLLARLESGFVEQLRTRVVNALATAEWAALTRLRHGRVAHVLSADIRSCGLAAHLTLQSAVAIVVLCLHITLALLLSLPIAAIVMLLLMIGGLALRSTLRRSRQLGSELTESSYRLSDDTNQFLGGLKLAFSQNLQDGFAREYRNTVAYGVKREIAFARQRSAGQVALTSLAACVAGIALLLGFGVFGTSPSALIALLVVLARMSGPTAQVQQNLQYIAHSLPAYEQIRRLVDELAINSAKPSADDADLDVGQPGDIVFVNVSFTYHEAAGRAASLADIDLTLRGGEFVGIAGSSGAGKTTLLDLLVGLLPPDKGEISVGGRRLDGAWLAAWRNRLSYVSQDPYLFNDSVAGNLRWARPDASVEEMRRALAIAGAERLLDRFPQGLHTVVGERGTLLSGGERQRIALARALIRRPTLLILDEATNAIDVEAERTILQELAALCPRPIIIMVAHREQSLALCERIITLDKGRIVASGSMPARSTVAEQD